MPRTASATRYAIQVDGRNLFLLAGDFPYHRLPHRHWAETLARLRGAHLNAVTISASWAWHEPEEGEFDLWGQSSPQRNLAAALALCAELDLFVILGAGPHIGDGWPGGGIPEWLLRAHPEIRARDAHGRPADPAADCPPITYLHPVYQAYAAGWYQCLLPLLRNSLVSEHGTVVAVEIDHRPSYGCGLQESDPLLVDYSPWVVGREGRPGLYQRWLAAQYGSVEDLNRRYRTRYRAFAEVQPPHRPAVSYQELPWFADWRRCKMDLLNQHLEYLYDWLRDGDVDVPLIVVDPYQSPLAARHCADYFRLRGKPLLVAHAPEPHPAAPQPSRGPALGQVVGTVELARRGARGAALPPLSLDTPGAASSPLPGNGVELLCALQLGHGVNALGLSALAGDTLRLPGGPDANSHDSDAPGRPLGDVRPRLGAIRRLGRFLATHGERLLHTEPLADVAFGWYEPYEDCGRQGDARTFGWRDDYGAMLAAHFGLAHDGRRAAGGGLLDLAAVSGLGFGMLDLQRDPLEEWLEYPQLWVLGLDFMAATVQRELISYVRAGGSLVMLPRVPYLDEHLRPCPLLDALFPARPLPQPDGAAGRSVSAGDGDELPVIGCVDTFGLPSGGEALAWEQPSGRACAYRTAYGRGTATLLGFTMAPPVEAAAQRRFVNLVVGRAGVRRHALSEAAQLHIVERATPAGSADPAGYLFAVNPWASPVRSRLTYTNPQTRQQAVLPRRLAGLEFGGQGALILCLEVPIPGTGLTIAYATSQVQSWAIAGDAVTLTLYGPPHTMGELGLRAAPQAKALQAACSQLLADELGELVLFTYPHHQGAAILHLRY